MGGVMAAGPPQPQLVRCKRFGCDKMFDPTRVEETVCVYHKSPPIFHETAKYWSCCVDKKAYDFDEFMAIPGCCRGHCSTEDPKKKFLGGQDLRDENKPKRLDDEIPTDPRKKLDLLGKGLQEIGVDGDSFERFWGRLSVKHGDLNGVVTKIRSDITSMLEDWGEDVNMPD